MAAAHHPATRKSDKKVTRTITDIERAVDKAEKCCYRVMKRDVQPAFKSMYGVYMRLLPEASSQSSLQELK